MPAHPDPRRPDRVYKYKPFLNGKIRPGMDDLTSEYANIFAMVFSVLSLTLRSKASAWISLFASVMCFANAKCGEDKRHIASSFVLAVASLGACYMQDPRPINLLWVLN